MNFSYKCYILVNKFLLLWLIFKNILKALKLNIIKLEILINKFLNSISSIKHFQ